jgi:excisionase family DNA binding protein
MGDMTLAPRNREERRHPELTVDERLWRAEDVAERFRISRSKVYEMLKSGQLRSLRIGGSRRIPESAIRELLESLS